MGHSQEPDLRQPPLQLEVLGDVKRLVYYINSLRYSIVYPDRKVCPEHSAVLHCTVLQVKYCLTVRQPPDSLNLPSQVWCAVQSCS